MSKVLDILDNYSLSDFTKIENDDKIIYKRYFGDICPYTTNVSKQWVTKITYNKLNDKILAESYIECPKCESKMKEIKSKESWIGGLIPFKSKVYTFKCSECNYTLEG